METLISTTSCLRMTHKLPVDICEDLFVPSFLQQEFLEWLNPEKTWQLHLHSGPGRGKVCDLLCGIRSES